MSSMIFICFFISLSGLRRGNLSGRWGPSKIDCLYFYTFFRREASSTSITSLFLPLLSEPRRLGLLLEEEWAFNTSFESSDCC